MDDHLGATPLSVIYFVYYCYYDYYYCLYKYVLLLAQRMLLQISYGVAPTKLTLLRSQGLARPEATCANAAVVQGWAESLPPR